MLKQTLKKSAILEDSAVLALLNEKEIFSLVPTAILSSKKGKVSTMFLIQWLGGKQQQASRETKKSLQATLADFLADKEILKGEAMPSDH